MVHPRFTIMTLLSLMLRSSAAFSVRRHVMTTRRPIVSSSSAVSIFSPFRHRHQACRFRNTNAEDEEEIILQTSPPTRTRTRTAATTTIDKKSKNFQVTAPFEPMGDQPQAISELCEQLENNEKFSILRGITGTGKTLVMAHVIANWGKPTLVLCHNKTLAAQLARELRSFLSKNAVELFVSYYNHYIPESFKETTGRYTAKKSSVNKEIDALRHRATRALLTRRDVVVVSSVSCIYGLGLPKEYLDASTEISVGDHWTSPDDFIQKLDAMLYQEEPSEDEFNRGNYAVAVVHDRNNNDMFANTTTVTLWPPHEMFPMRVDLQKKRKGTTEVAGGGGGDDDDDGTCGWFIKSIYVGQKNGSYPVDSFCVFPAKHHITSGDRLERACLAIEEEMRQEVNVFMAQGKMVEAARLQKRVTNDLLLLRETGFCPGGENYSRHFAGRDEGEPPDTLINYMSNNGDGDWLLIADESHVTIPQLKAMYNGDRARKQKLVKHGFRLPSALDNRPLKEGEFWEQVQQGIFVSATPSKRDLESSEKEPIDMVIRPTYVCDPVIEVRPSKGQLEDLLHEIRLRANKPRRNKERTLVVALTIRDAEDLASYLNDNDVSSAYIHSKMTTNERCDALKALQSGEIDCLVGVNLLREGLDLPQVSLVAILNADSEGFLRSETALFQTIGRAARNKDGMAILYASRITDSMKSCIKITKLRREKQLAYNAKYGHEMKSTKGSSTLSIFDLCKEQIQMEQQQLESSSSNGSSSQDAQQRSLSSGQEEEYSPDVTVALSPVGGVRRSGSDATTKVATDHVPSSPGVYFWKDSSGNILYIGKAKKLKSRVNSYLSPSAKHSARIKVMLRKAHKVDIILTASERDALLLESNAIKHYQPSYNVLLKDDESYPYICASVGDKLPRFFISPSRQRQGNSKHYRYYGPYTNITEINTVLNEIEEKYQLRKKMFLVRLGDESTKEYNDLFSQALEEVFGSSNNNNKNNDDSLAAKRAEFEEAASLFDNKRNHCRDVVAVARVPGEENDAVVHVVQLREGLVFGRFSYTCQLPNTGAGSDSTEEEEEDFFSIAVQSVLERQHYPSGEESRNGRFSFFPNEILCQYLPDDTTDLLRSIQKSRKQIEPDRTNRVRLRTVKAGVSSTQKEAEDTKALDFAISNAEQAALEKSMTTNKRATKTSLDGTAVNELVDLLNLDKDPVRIECYDISHTQGQYPVGSRVVFLKGNPAPHLYRKFNIRSPIGNDDYASLEEVFERRFHRAWVNGEGGPVNESDPWSLPDLILIDGGPGQLNAATKGMAKAGIFPRTKKHDGTVITSVPKLSGPGRRALVNVCALAKNQEELFVHGTNEPINDASDSPALLLLRSLRDESHRFALQAHRKRRSIRNST